MHLNGFKKRLDTSLNFLVSSMVSRLSVEGVATVGVLCEAVSWGEL